MRPEVETRQGVIVVYHYGPAHSRAVCSCGWAGRRRVLRAFANHDAWSHFAAGSCRLASPLVVYRH